MRIAIVRGAFLNPFEFQLYGPLVKRHDLLAVGADWQFYRPSNPWEQAAHLKPSLWGSSLASWSPTAVVRANRVCSWTLGRSFGLWRLDAAVGPVDVIHAAETYFTMTYQSMRLAKAQGIPLVVTVSENLPHLGETHPIRRRRKFEVMRCASRFVAITETTKRMLLEEGVSESKIEVIPWSLDLNRFSPGVKDLLWLRKLKLEARDFIVLFVGRFIKEKGIEELLAAIPALQAKASERRLRFVFFGEGPLQGQIQSAVMRWPDSVRLHPPVPYEDLPKVHRLADLFVLPSKPGPKIAEQFGIVLIESMATGIPVISTPVGSIPDVVGDAAFLVKPGSTQALAEAIEALVSSDDERHRRAAAGIFRTQRLYDARVNAERLEALYEHVTRR